ncbi:hypothetical protein [Streptomyces sp. NPDC001139]
MSTPERTDYVAGYFNPAELAQNYRCSHCRSTTEVTTGEHGGLRLVISHDPGCPVLNGVLSVLPDAQRAASAPDAIQL